MTNTKIERLVRIKREGLNSLRQDLMRLGQMLSLSESALEAKASEENDFIKGIQALEVTGSALYPAEMLASRNYLIHLEVQIKTIQNELAELNRQLENARFAVNQAYVEIKALEKVSENKKNELVLKQSRRNQFIVDEAELIRFERMRIH